MQKGDGVTIAHDFHTAFVVGPSTHGFLDFRKTGFPILRTGTDCALHSGPDFSCSGRSCNAAFTRSTLMSVSVFRSVPFNRSGVAEACEVCDDCALAMEEPVRKSAVVPSTTIFNIGDLLK